MIKALALLMLLPTIALAEDFRMLTWNVYMLPKPVKFSNQKNRSEAQATEIRKVAHEFDFVVLNEAFTKRSRNNIASALEVEMPHTAYLPRHGGWKKIMDSGVMVLSRYPMKVLGSDYYNECGKADCYASKGVLLVEVSLPSGKKIQVAATHMQCGKEKKYADIRTTQFAQIESLLQKFDAEGIPQILAGDLNLNSEAVEEYTYALDQLKMMTIDPTGPFKTTKSSETSCLKVKPNTNPKGWLDHVLLQDNGGRTTVKDKSAFQFKGQVNGKMCDLSDHLPVKATIVVEN